MLFKRAGRVFIVLIIAVALILLCLNLLDNKNNDPKDLFWKSLGTSLETDSVTKQTRFVDDQGTTKITTLTQIGGQSKAHIVVDVNSDSDRSVSEYLAYPDSIYVRLSKIESSNKENLKIIESVIDRWTKLDEGYDRDLFFSNFRMNNYSFPILGLDQDKSESLVEYAKSQKIFKFKNIKKVNDQGREKYVYDLTVNEENYYRFLNQALREAGDKTVSLDSEEVTSDGGVDIEMTIDSISGRLDKAVDDKGNSEVYSSYGVKSLTPRPNDGKLIKITELNDKIQQLH